MRRSMSSLWWRDSNQTASGKPGAVQVLLFRLWSGCLRAVVIVKPETVLRWHRKGFQVFWSWKSRLSLPFIPSALSTAARL